MTIVSGQNNAVYSDVSCAVYGSNRLQETGESEIGRERGKRGGMGGEY